MIPKTPSNVDDTVNSEEYKTMAANQEEELSLCDFPLNLSEDDEAQKEDSSPKSQHLMRSSSFSLADFPLNLSDDDEPEEKEPSQSSHCYNRRSTSQLPDFFEFFNDRNPENTIMSHAEDIISCGKLVPYKQPPLFDDQILKSVSADDEDAVNLSRRYCESLPELNATRSNSSASTGQMRSSRSLDSKKLRRNSSLVMKSKASDIHRGLSKDTLVKSEGFKVPKPWWYSMVFGSAKFPAEMDLRDMKNRQVRRKPATMLPTLEPGGRVPVNRRSSWGEDLLRLLSCKSHASVAVKSSVGLVSQV